VSYYIHQTHGRLRVRTPFVKDDPAAAQRAHEALSGLCGVTSVRCSVTTGSITVAYEPAEVTSGALINALSAAGLLEGIVGFPLPFRAAPRKESDAASKWLGLAVKILVPVLAERAFGKPGKLIASTLL
jgi:hypothetical protein